MFFSNNTKNKHKGPGLIKMVMGAATFFGVSSTVLIIVGVFLASKGVKKAYSTITDKVDSATGDFEDDARSMLKDKKRELSTSDKDTEMWQTVLKQALSYVIKQL